MLMAILCFLPLIMFGGCGSINTDSTLNGCEKIENVQTVSVYGYSKDYSYSPYNNEVWFDKQRERIIFYIGKNRENEQYTSFQKYDFPSSRCSLTYFATNI